MSCRQRLLSLRSFSTPAVSLVLALLPGGCAIDVTSLIPFTDTSDTTVASDTTGAGDRIVPASQVAGADDGSDSAASPVITGSIAGRAGTPAPPPPPAARRYPEVNAVPAPPRQVAAPASPQPRQQITPMSNLAAAVPQPAAPAMLPQRPAQAPSSVRVATGAPQSMSHESTMSAPVRAQRTTVKPVPVAAPLPQAPTVTVAAAPVPKPQPPRVESSAHRVAPGDTLYGIARRHGLAMVDLARANALTPPYVIHPGQQLTIPRVATATLNDVAADPVHTGAIADAATTGPRRLAGARLHHAKKPSAEAAAAEAYSDVVRNSKMMPGQTLFSF